MAIAAVELLAHREKIARPKVELASTDGPQKIEVSPPGITQIMRDNPLTFWEARWQGFCDLGAKCLTAQARPR